MSAKSPIAEKVTRFLRSARPAICALLLIQALIIAIPTAAQIDPRSAKPATAGGNAGPAGICATLFRHISIETLTDSFTNGALWERESELAECVNRLHAPKTIPEATTFIRKTQELHNVRAIMLARALNFLGQEGMATKWMTAPIPKEGR